MNDSRQKIYDALSKRYDMGSFEEFNSKLDNEGSRRKVYDAMSEMYDMGDYDTFSTKLGYGPSQAQPQQPEPQPQQPAPQSQSQPSVAQAKRQALSEKTAAQGAARAQQNFGSFMQAVNQGFGAPQEEPETVNVPFLTSKQKAERAKAQAEVEAQEKAQAEAIPEEERLTEAEKAYYTASTGDMLRGVQGAEFDFGRTAERVKSDTSLPSYALQEAVEIRRLKDNADKQISEAMGGLPVKDGEVNYGELNKWANDVLNKFGYDEAKIEWYSGWEGNSPTGLTRENLHYNLAKGKVAGVFDSDADADIRKDEMRAYDAALALEKFSRRAKQEEEVLKGERGSFGQGFTEGTITDMITDLISDAPTLLKIADRVEKGEKLLPIEEKLIATYVSSNSLQAALQDQDRWYRYGKMGRDLTEFLLSMVFTGGIGGLVKTGTAAVTTASQYVAKRLTWEGAKSVIWANTKQLPGIFVSELIRQPFMFTKQREYARNMIGLYDFGYDQDARKFTVKRNDNTVAGAILKPTAEGAVMNTVFRFWGSMDNAMMQWIGKSKLLSKTAGDVIKESGNITGNSVWSNVGEQLNKIGATHIPTMFVQMPTADLFSALAVGDLEKIKAMGTGRYWGDLTAASIMIGGGRSIVGLAARPMAAAQEYRTRMKNYNSSIDAMEKMQFGSENVKGFQKRCVDVFRQDAAGGKDFTGQRLKIRALGKEMAEAYKRVQEELNRVMDAYVKKGDTSLKERAERLSQEVQEYEALGNVISDMEVQSLYAKGTTEGMDVVLQDHIGEFENRTAKGGYVTLVQSRADGKTYFLLDNRGDVSIVRGMTKDAKQFTMKTGEYNVVSSVPKELYLARVATMGMELGNMIEANRGAKDAVIQQYNRENFRGDTRPTTYTPKDSRFEQNVFYNGKAAKTRSVVYDDGTVLIEDEDGNRSWVNADELTTEYGEPFTARAEPAGDVSVRSQEGGLPEAETPLALGEGGERTAPAEGAEAVVPEAPAAPAVPGAASALAEGQTAYIGDEPVTIMSLSEDGQTAIVDVAGNPMEVNTSDLRPAAANAPEAAAATVEQTPDVENTVGEASAGEAATGTPTADAAAGETAPVTGAPQAETERPPLPMQKNGEVDYNTLLQDDPARFIEEWDKVEGPGAGVEAIMGARESVNSQIEKLQKTLEKPSADFNKRAADRKKLQALQARKEAMDKAIEPYEKAVDKIDEAVANGDIPGLGDQAGTPASAEGPISLEGVDIQGQETAPETQPDSDLFNQPETPSVDFNQLMAEDPAKFIEEYDKRFGEGMGKARLATVSQSLGAEIANTKRALDRTKDMNKAAELQGKIENLSKQKRAIDDVLNPVVQMPQGEVRGAKADVAIAERWTNAPKVDGYSQTRTLPDGTKLKGHWVLTEAGAATPSHDPYTLQPSEGFPTSAAGTTVNDNDYSDKFMNVQTMAQTYDGRALDNPVFVKDGVVVSGNNRTMSGIVAADRGWDGAYVEELGNRAQSYGFTPEQIAQMRHPRVYFEIDDDFAFTTENFSKFNARDTKSKSLVEKAVNATKRDLSRVTGQIVSEVFARNENGSLVFPTLADVYKSRNAQLSILGVLMNNGIINRNEMPDYFNEKDGTFTQGGREFLESILVGSVLNEESVKILSYPGTRQYRAAILKAMPELLEMKKIKDNILDDINAGLSYLYEANRKGMAVELLFKTNDLFNPKKFSEGGAVSSMVLEEGPEKFRLFASAFNTHMNGGIDLFTGQEPTKEGFYEEYGRQKLTEKQLRALADARENNRIIAEQEELLREGGEGVPERRAEGNSGTPEGQVQEVRQNEKAPAAEAPSDVLQTFEARLKDAGEFNGWKGTVELYLTQKGISDLKKAGVNVKGMGLREAYDAVADKLGQKPAFEEDPIRVHKEFPEPQPRQAVRDAVIDKIRDLKVDVFTDEKVGQEVCDIYVKIDKLRQEREKTSDAQKIAEIDSQIAGLRQDVEKLVGKDVSLFRGPGGRIYGFTADDRIFIDPNAPADTPIHEYTHLWAKMFRKINPKEWKNIIALMKKAGEGTWWKRIKEAYPELKTDSEIAEEVLAHYSGARGARRIREEMERIRGDKGMPASMKMKALQALHNLRMALDKFWKTVAEYLGIKFTTAEEVADRVLADIDRGINPKEVMKRMAESDRQVVKAKEVLDYFNSKGFKDGQIVRSITDHGVSTYIEGSWGAQPFTKYRISDHGMGQYRKQTEISFNYDTKPETLYHLGVGFGNGRKGVLSGAEQQKLAAGKSEYDRLWEQHKDKFEGLKFSRWQSPMDMKEALEQKPFLRDAKYLQQRQNSDGTFTYEFSEPGRQTPENRPSVGMLRAIDGDALTPENSKNIKATEIREQRELNKVEPTKKEMVAAAKKAMPETKAIDKDGNPLEVFHGPLRKGITVFNDKVKRSNAPQGTYWFNSLYKVAKTYTEEGVEPMGVFLNMKNPLVVDAKGANHDELPNRYEVYIDSKDIDRYFDIYEDALAFAKKNGGSEKDIIPDGVTSVNVYAERARSRGYDGLIVKNVIDIGDVDNHNEIDYKEYTGTDYVVFSPEQIKSADPVTYDDNGKPIPLSERFSTKSDIRYQKSLDTPLGRKLNEAGPTKKEIVAEAKKKMPNTKAVDRYGNPRLIYTGTTSKTPITEFKGDIWMNSNPSVAGQYTHKRRALSVDPVQSGRVMPVFVNLENPLVVDAKRSNFYNIKVDWSDKRVSADDIVAYAKKNGYDGVIIKDVKDNMFSNDTAIGTDYVAFKSSQVKSAGASYETKERWHYPWDKYEDIKSETGNTYDDNGNPIPLEDRFDTSEDDIRFSKDLEDRLDKALDETGEKIQAAKDTRKAKLDEMDGKIKKVNKGLVKAAQREYDKATVQAVTDLAKELLSEKLIDPESIRGLKSMLTTIGHVTGRESIRSSVMGIMNIVASSQIKNQKEYLQDLLKTKGVKTNSNGVKVQGRVGLGAQEMLKALNESIGMEKEDVLDLYDNAFEDYRKFPTEGNQGTFAGYVKALEYIEDVRKEQSALKVKETEIEAKRKEMWSDYEANKGTEEGKQKLKVYKEFLDASREEMLRARLHLAETSKTFNDRLAMDIEKGKLEGKAFKDADLKLVNDVRHDANSDMKFRVISEQSNPGNFATNNPATRVLLSSLPTFEMFMKFFGRRSTRGEGALYNRFVRGLQDAEDVEFTNLDRSLETIKAKGKEIFGKKRGLAQAAFWSERGMGIKVKWLDAGQEREFEISQGIGAYIHAVNKMTDGKMHLRAMGITEEDVAAIEEKVDPKFLEFIDYLQDEFLPDMWRRMNEVHERVFGASLPKIEHYFPLRINKNALVREETLEDDGTINLPSTITGNIKSRTKNVAALDLKNCNAFSVALQYMQEMEHWAAYVPMIRQMNILLSYKRFRNAVKGMVTAYGSGENTWKTFAKCCRLAAGVYHPLGSDSEYDKYTVNLSKSLAAAKIALRIYTGFKQLFSAPAYLSDANIAILAKNISNPVSWVLCWNWCYNNLPNFKKRWKSRIAGETRLLPSDKDWAMWSTKLADISSKIGLTPNAFVDALTVSIGAKSIYETRLRNYKKMGYPKEKAEAKARQDAEVAYNETQQSSGGMFVSPIQIDRTAGAFMRSTFRNASFAYERQMIQGMRNLRNMARLGEKEMVDFMTKQAVKEGADEAKAHKFFKREYKRAWARESFRVALFGYGMQFAWYAGAAMPYFIWGKDKKKKQNMLETSAVNAMFGPIEGLPYGGTISSWGTKAVMGDQYAWRNPKVASSSVLGDDIDNAIRLWGSDQMAAANETINLIVQMGIGVNPQTVWDVYLAVENAVKGDPDMERETLLCIMRVLQVPQSQINEIMIDEMGLPASKCKELTVKEFAERYARYKLKRGAFLTRGGYSEDKEAEVMGRYEKQFKKYWKERIKLDEGEDAVKTKTLKQLKAEADAALKAGDQEGYENAVKGYRSQKTKNAFKNAKKKLQTAIDAEADPEKKAKLEKKLEQLEEKENNVE